MRKRNKGHMLEISEYKMLVHGCNITKPSLVAEEFGISQAKVDKIVRQVKVRLAEQQALKKYQPFTSGLPKRRPTQVQ